jgi:hypothetical protein
MASAIASAPTSLPPSAEDEIATQDSFGGVVNVHVAPTSGEVKMPAAAPRRMELAPATRVPSAEQAMEVQLSDGDAVGLQGEPELVEQKISSCAIRPASRRHPADQSKARSEPGRTDWLWS